MRTELLEHLACPACEGDLELERADEESDDEIFSGVLACNSRAARYQIHLASIPLLRLHQAVRRLPGLRPDSRKSERTVRNRTLKELELTWFDALSPKYDSRHSEAKVIGWFEHLGFTEIDTIEEPKVGVRGIAPAQKAHPGSLDRRVDRRRSYP